MDGRREIAASPSKRAAPSWLPSSTSIAPTDRCVDEDEEEDDAVDQLVMMPLLGSRYAAERASSSFDVDDVSDSSLHEDVEQAIQFEVEP